MKPLLIALLFPLVLAGCAQYENRRGVEVTWDAANLDGIEVGETTRRDILTRLGPPSQLIAMEDETVLYYLYEHARGDGLILVVYNRFEMDTRYDRAVFIFDRDDVLVEYATKVQPDA